MTDIDELRRTWQAEDTADPPPPLAGADLMRIVSRRARACREEALRRLRKELITYTLLALGTVGILSVSHPRVWLQAAAALVALYGAFVALIWYKARALEQVALDATLSDSIRRMIAVLTGWMTAYLALYVVAIAAGGIVVLALIARRGMGLLWWGLSGGWAVFLVWNWAAGRSYVRREFGQHRDALVGVLRDLEEP